MNKKKPKLLGLNLSEFPGIEEKFEAVFNFLEIIGVSCELSDEQDPGSLNTEKVLVTQIVVTEGTPTYIQSLTQEIRKILIKSVDDFIYGEENVLYDMEQTLIKLKNRCILQSKVHDINNIMEYNADKIIFLTYHDPPIRLYLEQLTFSLLASTNLTNHFYIRKEFYKAMTEILDSKISELSEPPYFTKQPYQWKSESELAASPLYEIAELLYALIKKRIKIRDGQKGSTAKLVKSFYNLFGYDDNTYHQKVQQMKNREDGKSWLQELPEYIIGIQNKDGNTKN